MTKANDNSAPQAEVLDLVLAYVLGNVSEDERIDVESRLAMGDPEVLLSYHQAMATLAELPRALSAAVPPPFVKERVMARVHEDADQLVIASEAYESYRPPMSILSRVLDYVPGYGSFQWSGLFAGSMLRRRGPFHIRTVGLAGLIFAGFFASAYAYNEVRTVLRKAEHEQAKVVERVRNTKAFKEKYRVVHSAIAAAFPERNLENDISVGPETGSIAVAASQPDLKGSYDISLNPGLRPSAASKPRGPELNAIAAHKDAPRTDRIGIDMDLVHAQFFFTSDPHSIHYTLAPVNGVQGGSGKVYWNNTHSDALFTIGELKPTTEDTHYVLYYVLDDGTLDRVLVFGAASSARQSFFLSKAPGPHVKGVKLILESGIKTGSLNRETMLSGTTRIKAAQQ